MASLRARLVRAQSDPSEPKASAAAAGPGSTSGLVLADGPGRELLSASPSTRTPMAAYVAEGEPDFLALACAWGDADEDAPACFGVVAGAWTDAIGGRFPAGACVTIATHADDAGERYARDIAASLSPRCTVRRWRAPETA